ncbi:hypothetical protein GCM10027294_43420 [Marinactinospora endophytica]
MNHSPHAVTRAREAAGLTKTDFAQLLGCSLSLVSEMESGTRNASRERLARMADVLGVPTNTLTSEPTE